MKKKLVGTIYETTGVVKVTGEFLSHLLQLPDGAVITGCSYDQTDHCITLAIGHQRPMLAPSDDDHTHVAGLPDGEWEGTGDDDADTPITIIE